MNYLTYTRHYSVSRSKIAYKVFSYFKSNYPLPPNLQYFEFVNDAQDKGKLWGQSKQISQSLSGSDFLKVFYQQSDKMVYYQDIADERPLPHDLEEIKISSKQFLDPWQKNINIR